MLTKDLLKVNLKKGMISPQFIDPQNTQACDVANRLLTLVRKSIGETQASIEETLYDEIATESMDFAPGFVKLILDQLEYSETTPDLEEERWDLILAAQKFRQEHYFKSKEEFQDSFSVIPGRDFASLSNSLYADLPEFKRVIKIWDVEAQNLLHRYNTSLVQSLLLLAPKVEIHISFSNAVEKRNLFRAIKFHRLVVGNVKVEGGDLSFTIDGPLSLLVNTSAYGMRLANFFPRLVQTKHWKMEALIKYKKRDHQLVLSERDGLQSHYKDASDFRPDEEFQQFLTAYNQTSSDWHAEWCDDLVALGAQTFCFPDMTFIHKAKARRIHLEFFHRWHKGELEKRINHLQNSKEINVIIGVCNSLIKRANMSASSIQEDDFEKFGFIFRGLPTPKAVSALLSRIYAD
jgi:predicted nuclease of restriction endonuclease-like RecB superfamily